VRETETGHIFWAHVGKCSREEGTGGAKEEGQSGLDHVQRVQISGFCDYTTVCRLLANLAKPQ
jgi:hypothetical protein